MQPIASPSGGAWTADPERDGTAGRRNLTPGQHNQRLGRRGEDLAAAHLERVGLRVLERNWRCDLGEIDIVAADGAVIVGCEVKTRSGQTYGPPQEGVDGRKLVRLHRLVYRWAEQRGYSPDSVRVDLLGVLLTADRKRRIEHLVGVC